MVSADLYPPLPLVPMNLPRTRRGERHPNAKLTAEQISEAARLEEEEDLTPAQIVARLELKCSPETLRRALRGETYQQE